jgi:glycosyltransferase involved in cell wall biosynthesis
MTSDPRVSVVMPAFRAEATIHASVQSALAQTLSDFEMIIVDDASPVPVSTSIEDIADPRLRVIGRQKNGGAGAARNDALALARAPVIATLDADDLWEPEYLESILPRFADPIVGLVYTNGVLHAADGGERLLFSGTEKHPLSFDTLAEANHLRTPGTAIRTDAVRAIGGWRRRLCEDWSVALELLLHGWRFDYVDRPLFHYREPDYGAHHYDEETLRRAESAMWVSLGMRYPRLVRHPEFSRRIADELRRRRRSLSFRRRRQRA